MNIKKLIKYKDALKKVFNGNRIFIIDRKNVF